MHNWPRLVGALALSLPPGEDPRDLAQEAFVRAWEHWKDLANHQQPDAWLFLTAFRLASNMRRSLSRRRHLSHTTAPRDDFAHSEEVADLMALMRGIAPRQRAALMLRFYYGLSTSDAAGLMKCSDGTVKSSVFRGREAIRGLEARAAT